jgi:hypothetical protein
MSGTHAAGGVSGRGRGVFSLPSTRPGRWSVWLMVAFVVMFIINATVFMPSTVEIPLRTTILPFYGIAMLACGLAAGVVSLIAIIREHESSWLVWLPLLAGMFVLFFVAGELLVPH